jgi:putative toxin-antitoxin system antitoxin component (TIGR02293 family)
MISNERTTSPTSHDETAWAARIGYVTTRSSQVFSRRAGYSAQWLCTPNPALQGETPLEALASDSGFEVVKELLTKIEQGNYA